jgi:hypothetical protein
VGLPPVLPEDMFLKVLDHRIGIVQWCFKEACGSIPESSDLHRDLELAEVVLAIGRCGEPGKKLTPEMGRAVGLVWRLANSFTILKQSGIGFAQHLKAMKDGQTEFGLRSSETEGGFKDFELELHVAALLSDRGLKGVRLHEPGHPFDISIQDSLQLECVHPSSGKGIAKQITKFGKDLSRAGKCGAMVVGMEDVLQLGRLPLVKSPSDVLAYAQVGLDTILDDRGEGWIKNFEANEAITTIYFTATAPVFLDEGNTASFSLFPLNALGPRRLTGDKGLDLLVEQFLLGMK